MKPSLMVAVCLFGGSGVAFADAGSGAAPASADAGPSAPAPAAGDWMSLDSRPLIVPMGRLAIDAVVPMFETSFTADVGGMAESESNFAVGAVIAGTYGVSDKLEVGADYAFSLDSFSLTPTLTARAAYLALHQDKLDLAVAAAFSVDTNSGGDVDLLVGAWLRYRLAPKLCLFTGQPGMIPQVGGGAGAVFFGPVAYQLDITLNNGQPVSFALPVGASYQITPNIFGYAQVLIADLAISGGSSAYIFSDFIPITLGAFYSMDKLDLGISFGDDLKNAGDFYAFTLNARYWVK